LQKLTIGVFMSRNKSDHYRRTIENVPEAVVESPAVTGGIGSGATAVLTVDEGTITSVEVMTGQPLYVGDTITIVDSPIEEKIRQLVDDAPIPDVEGWDNDMESAPIDGNRIMVSQTGKDQGALVYWRISRYVDKKTLRYIPKGRWTDFLTKVDIAFTPHYWKPYNPEEYWPLQGVKE
jgi:hypothetical protein